MKFFDKSEFNCQYTGENEMHPEFLQKLDELREACGFPFVITSGYRSPDHPIEAAKDSPGTHAQGIAADIAVTSSVDRYTLINYAFQQGFTGIGVDSGFIHLDIRNTIPVIWTY
tara:strand:+ start:175 stop:516 length:342 start_codon:yes stop_codon:yes gene_type:complete